MTLAAWPIGETSPGPCQAVLTPMDFRHGGDLAHGRQAAGLRDVDADVIDQPAGDQRGPFVRAVEQFAHGDGGGALTADLAEVVDVFGRKRVLHEEHFEALGVFQELHGLVRRDALVDVVQQLDLVAQLLAALFEQLQRTADVIGRLEDGGGA